MCKHQQRFGLTFINLAFSRKLQLYIFNSAFVPGWTNNEFPAFANTQTLIAILERHPAMINSLLYSIQNLITLSPTEIGIVTSLFKEKSYKKGDFFLEEGRICKQVGFVAKGLLRYYINHDGEEKTYAFSQENDYVCNYESFLPQSPSSKIIQALEDSDVLVISHADLQLLYANVREGERFGRIAIESIFIQLLKDVSSFYTETPELRYERFLKNHADLQQRISQYHIASFVGVKPQSLSRIRKRISTQF